jgi:hypothetical protein
MKITNKLNLPDSFVQMATSDYEFGEKEYRVTSLLKGIRETLLERRHYDEIEQDVSDMIWLLFGTAVHSVLENYEEKGHEIKENRLYSMFGDYTLSGQFDLYNYETATVTDYKTCSVWKVIKEDYDDWRKQLLIYAYMLKEIGFPCNKGEVVAIMKDHSNSKAKFDKTYPELPVRKISFRFDDREFKEIEEFLNSKFDEIRELEFVSDDRLPLCTDEERYNSGDKFAVMKNGRKTALRVLDNLEDAEDWKRLNGGDFIETRKGEDKKCTDYCRVAKFCSYSKENGYDRD